MDKIRFSDTTTYIIDLFVNSGYGVYLKQAIQQDHKLLILKADDEIKITFVSGLNGIAEQWIIEPKNEDKIIIDFDNKLVEQYVEVFVGR